MTSCAQEFAWFFSDSPTNHNSAVMDARRDLKKNLKIQISSCSLSKIQSLPAVRHGKACEDENPFLCTRGNSCTQVHCWKSQHFSAPVVGTLLPVEVQTGLPTHLPRPSPANSCLMPVWEVWLIKASVFFQTPCAILKSKPLYFLTSYQEKKNDSGLKRSVWKLTFLAIKWTSLTSSSQPSGHQDKT